MCRFACALLMFAAATTVVTAAENGPGRPSIVIIMSDDMGYSDPGCIGGEIQTPNIDRLAQHGLRFTQFYNTARCCPTRASLMTGVYPHQAGVGHMTWKQLDLPGYRSDLSKHTPTLAELLRSSGYATYMTGKWHLTINDLPNEPKDNWPRQRGEVYAAQIDRMDEGIGKIIDALEAAGRLENTLILFLHDNGGCDETNGRTARLPKGDLNPRDHKPADTQWNSRPRTTRDGRIVKGGPKVMPGPDDTFIAYGANWANVSNTPFREYKHYVHEGGISTPLIAHWPAGIARRGEMDRTPGHVIDVVVTCAQLAGVAFPAEFIGKPTTPLQGVSFAAAFQAGGQPAPRNRPIFFEHEGNRAVRDGKWKLVAKGVKGPWELYDMEVDRTEMHDLGATEQRRAAEMAAAWQQWAETSNVLPLVPWAEQPAGAATGK